MKGLERYQRTIVKGREAYRTEASPVSRDGTRGLEFPDLAAVEQYESRCSLSRVVALPEQNFRILNAAELVSLVGLPVGQAVSVGLAEEQASQVPGEQDNCHVVQ